METLTITKSKIEVGEQILWSGANESIYTANIIQETEKAVKIDYALESIWSNGVVVFTRTAWLPKSGITTNDIGCLTLKPWMQNRFEGGPKIKKYFLKGDQKIFI